MPTHPPATETERELAGEVVRLTRENDYWRETAIAARKLADGHAETLREVRKALGLSLNARRREIVDAIRRAVAGAIIVAALTGLTSCATAADTEATSAHARRIVTLETIVAYQGHTIAAQAGSIASQERSIAELRTVSAVQDSEIALWRGAACRAIPAIRTSAACAR